MVLQPASWVAAATSASAKPARWTNVERIVFMKARPLGANPAFGLPGLLPLSNTDDNSLETEIGGNTEFKGESDTAQRNSLSGDISVTVADVLPNGNLVVRGEKRLNLNSGNEYVKIAGIVRPLDIAANNVVPSTKVADATIIYTGEGAESDATKMGWLGRFFTSALFPL